MNEVQEHEGLRIQLLSYDKPTQETERFYFLEMSTLQATCLIQNERRIESIKIVSYDSNDNYLDSKTIESFRTIGEFNSFFQKNTDYYIHDCDIELEKDLVLSSHDDGEVSLQMNVKSQDREIITEILNQHRIDVDLIPKLENSVGHYLEIDKKSKIVGDYKSFDEYVEKENK
ncbi:MAG: hypothetical protein OQJ96_13345 [Flavobacteriales bacterium]|nr:hypothetical protein [Flavobacteriales bacterium]MCW8911759.1 hypothetical protein [Flavobacteriales bacterium]MCW8937018.1 hypothetical protein [Flavobacteriales bacterium]MCW8968455.1 hypothetical protein [Flavobacteriales bacterium]MCW8989776.1 hypothetical protein [Flavobacteriales bacterium]